LWGSLGHDEILVASAWPIFDAELSKEEELEIPVQLNGKLIARFTVPANATDEALIQAALGHERVKARLEGKEIVKTIVVPKRLVNLVAK
jgi:leucyl-tRNA synthetase